MSETVQPIPEGFHTLTSYLCVKDPDAAIRFYGEAFGARTRSVSRRPDGGVLHAELRIGDSPLMLSGEWPDYGVFGPDPDKQPPVTMHIYVEDVDAAWRRAVDAGCTEVAPLMDAFWGDRYGKLVDPFGHHWGLASRVREMSDEEISAAAEAWFAQMGQAHEG